MAIKGKGRTRGRKAVAAPPRRALVVRKPPIWRRRWVWALVGLMAAGGILAGVLVNLHSHSVKAKKAREVAAVQDVFTKLRAKFPSDIQAVPPNLVVIFPSAGTDLSKIGTSLSAADAKAEGAKVEAAAKNAATGVQAVTISKYLTNEFKTDQATALDGQFLMAQAFTVYEQIGALIQTAADLTGPEQKALKDQIQLLINHAGALFDRGYGKIVSIADRLGVNTSVPFQAPPSAPPQPTSSPPATTSPTPSSPSPPASGSPSPSP